MSNTHESMTKDRGGVLTHAGRTEEVVPMYYINE